MNAIPRSRIVAHLAVTCDEDQASQARAAGLLAMLAQEPSHLVESRAWYQRRLEGLNPNLPEHRAAFTAFLAAEGAFFVRFLGLLPMEEGRWRQAFEDMEQFTDGMATSSKPASHVP